VQSKLPAQPIDVNLKCAVIYDMSTAYFRRFRMELNLADAALPQPLLPVGYEYLPWHPTLLERHATVKFESFQTEIDANVFQCLGKRAGCRRLMTQIANRQSFIPQATWLVTQAKTGKQASVDCGTIQGLRQGRELGAIQNVGIIPDHRGNGIGRAIVLQSLYGFRQAGITRVYLEVTAENGPAVGLYRSLGFQLVRTLFKAVDLD
jgi:ribosomal protein S18 acetylase RimI-like enzyme